MSQRALCVFGTALALLGGATGCEPITATALFPAPGDKIAYGAAPFPSDLFMDRGHVGTIEGLVDIAPLQVDALQPQLALLDGFGTRPVVQFFFDAPVDAASVPAHSSSTSDALFVVDVATGAPVAFDWRVDANKKSISGAIARGTVLEEGAHYAAFLTTRVRGVAGRIGGSAGFDALRRADKTVLPENWRSTRAAIDVLGRDDVVDVAAFTTAHGRDGLYRARAALDALPAPTVTFDDPTLVFAGDSRLHDLLGDPQRSNDGEAQLGWSNPTGMAHDHVAAVGTGTLHAITFRRADKTGVAAHDVDSGTWALDDAGAPIVDRAVDLPISFAVPKGTMPSTGWPVAFFGHGLGGSRAQMLAFVDTLAREGYVTVAIDADDHGSRYEDVDQTNNVAVRLGDAFAGVKNMRDGFGDVEGDQTAFALFHDFVNIAAMRDQMRESAVDLSQVVVALEHDVDLSPLVAGARVDGGHVAYLGESFGGVVGALFMSEEPDVHMFYLDVPGGGVLEYVGPNSPTLSVLYKLFMPSTYGIDRTLDRFDPLIGLGSALLDGADPLTYAPHVLRDRPSIGARVLGARHVVLAEVSGDEVMPNSSTNALARALDIPILAPAYDDASGLPIVDGPIAGNVDGQTAAIVHYAPANHGDNWSKAAGQRRFMPFTDDDTEFTELPAPIAITNPVSEAHEQVRALLRDFAADRVPKLGTTETPRHDFDDDGTSDADEIAAGTNPYGP